MTRVAAAGAAAGFDLVHAFNVRDYNAGAPELERLPGSGALGILIGNTRKLWPIFAQAVATDPKLAAAPHPLDAYVSERLTTLIKNASPHAQLIFSHLTSPRPFPIQRLADAVGFAAVSPSQLSIHPLHGLWFALRAVVVVDAEGPGAPAPELERPCRGCSAPCVPALERAIATSGTPLTSAAVAEHTQEWIAVRDACPVGQSSRYGDAQLQYHYAPSRSRIVPEP